MTHLREKSNNSQNMEGNIKNFNDLRVKMLFKNAPHVPCWGQTRIVQVTKLFFDIK